VPNGRIILSADAKAALDVRTAQVGTVSPPDTVPACTGLVAPWKQRAFTVSRLLGRIVALKARPGIGSKVIAEVRS